MAVSQPDVFSGYLTKTVASTILHGFGGIHQHLQNLLNYRAAPSAKARLRPPPPVLRSR